MDSDSIGDRLKEIQIDNCDNTENVKESMKEKVPKILSPDLNDVFHIFVNMLDIKSFMKLAVTSKKMYKRCMEDKGVEINVDVGILTAENKNGSVELNLYCEDMSLEQGKLFQVAAQKLPCKFRVQKFKTIGYTEDPWVSMKAVFTKLREIGVTKIDELMVEHVNREWESVIRIIKNFRVEMLRIDCPVETDTLRSFLQMNLEKLVYNFPVSPDLILKTATTIREIDLLEMGYVSEDKFKDMFYHDWKGVVVKCRVVNGNIMKIFKCDPWELPYSMRKDEAVNMDLAEKLPTVCCSLEQFRNFFTSFTTIGRSHYGPLPEKRPICFPLSENHFWMLDENENLMECSWKEDDEARWYKLAPDSFVEKIEHPALAKCMFWTILKKMKENDCYETFYEGLDEFNSWFDGVKKLDFGYSGPLPKERPLVFERVSPSGILCVVVLDDDRLLECKYAGFLTIQHCHYLNRPSILLTARNITDILQNQNCTNMRLHISFGVFRDGMELLKKSILVHQKRLIVFEITETECWYMIREAGRKAVWENGRLSISDFDGAPPAE